MLRRSFGSSILSLFEGLPSCFLFHALFLIIDFPDRRLCFLVHQQGFGFQYTQVETHQFLLRRGVATQCFFFWWWHLCFATSEKALPVFFLGYSIGKFFLHQSFRAFPFFFSCVSFLFPCLSGPLVYFPWRLHRNMLASLRGTKGNLGHPPQHKKLFPLDGISDEHVLT